MEDDGVDIEEDGWLQASEKVLSHSPLKEPSCWHFDLGLLVSRTRRQYVFVVYTRRFEALYYGSPRELIHSITTSNDDLQWTRPHSVRVLIGSLPWNPCWSWLVVAHRMWLRWHRASSGLKLWHFKFCTLGSLSGQLRNLAALLERPHGKEKRDLEFIWGEKGPAVHTCQLAPDFQLFPPRCPMCNRPSWTSSDCSCMADQQVSPNNSHSCER